MKISSINVAIALTVFCSLFSMVQAGDYDDKWKKKSDWKHKSKEFSSDTTTTLTTSTLSETSESQTLTLESSFFSSEEKSSESSVVTSESYSAEESSTSPTTSKESSSEETTSWTTTKPCKGKHCKPTESSVPESSAPETSSAPESSTVPELSVITTLFTTTIVVTEHCGKKKKCFSTYESTITETITLPTVPTKIAELEVNEATAAVEQVDGSGCPQLTATGDDGVVTVGQSCVVSPVSTHTVASYVGGGHANAPRGPGFFLTVVGIVLAL